MAGILDYATGGVNPFAAAAALPTPWRTGGIDWLLVITRFELHADTLERLPAYDQAKLDRSAAERKAAEDRVAGTGQTAEVARPRVATLETS